MTRTNSSLRQIISLISLVTASSERNGYQTDTGATEVQRALASLPPSSELWCSFLNFCVDDTTVAVPTPYNQSSVAPMPAPEPTGDEVAMDALCEFLQLCDLTTPTTPSPAPTPASTPDTDSYLFDLCVSIGLCVITTSGPATPQPTMFPTWKPPPAYLSTCEFLGNCPPSPAPSINATSAPTLAPSAIPTTLRPTSRPTQNPATSDFEDSPALDFLCTVLGICDLLNDSNPASHTAAPVTPNPTPAPTRPTLLCLVSRIC